MNGKHHHNSIIINTKLHIQWSTYKTTEKCTVYSYSKKNKIKLCCILTPFSIFYAKALIANFKTVWQVFAHVMSQCAYLNGSVKTRDFHILWKKRDFVHENCAKSRELCIVFWKCVLELQFECKACSCACSLAELVQGVGGWVTCGHCVSSTRMCV